MSVLIDRVMPPLWATHRVLDELEQVGGWLRIPQCLAVANGRGDGAGNGIKPGTTAVKGGITGTDLRTMPTGRDTLAATLRGVTSR
jgi:hypothetical protein